MSTLTTTCPHCGFDSEDEELCRSCGELIDDTPVKSVPFTEVLGTWLRNNCYLEAQNDLENLPDLAEECSMSPSPGSIWAIHYGDED